MKILQIFLLTIFAWGLVACGTDAADTVAPYNNATPLAVDKATQDSFKDALKGIKEAKLEVFAFKDDPAAIKTYYEAQYKDKGWVSKEADITEATKALQSLNGWALTYEKSGQIVSLVLTPGTTAANKFPTAQGQNVLTVIKAVK